MAYELVIRAGKPYLRRRPTGRTVEEASPKRLEALINFAVAAQKNYGKKYEDFIEGMIKDMKAPGRAPKPERIIELTIPELLQLAYEFKKRGLRMRLPAHYRISVKRPVVKLKVPA